MTTIQDLGLHYQSYQLYDVNFFGDIIKTLVTKKSCIIDTWISDTEQIYRNRYGSHLIIGLDIEWAPNYNSSIENPPATLQLCVVSDCIIIQLPYLPKLWSPSLLSFLDNENNTFVGVGIREDAAKLYNHYGVRVRNMVDLRELAAAKLGQGLLRTAGLRTLVKEVLGREIEKPRNVTMSNWDCAVLSLEQIQYACVDAFASFEIGWFLINRFSHIL